MAASDFFKSILAALNWRHLPYLLVIPILLFQALSMAGCVSNSPSLPDLYIVSFTKNTTNSPEVRLGYFGACARPSPNETTYTCLSTARSTANVILPELFPNLPPKSPLVPDLTVILSASLLLQSNIFVPILAGSALLFLIALVLFVLLKRRLGNPVPDKPLQATRLKTAMTACLCLSSALSFTSSLSLSETAGALQYSGMLVTGKDQVTVTPGLELQILQWLSFGFTLLFTGGVPWLLRGGGGYGEGYDGDKV